MKKQLLKKLVLNENWGSGILAIAVTFILLGFWFGFPKACLGAYNEKDLTWQFLAEDSEAFKTIVIEVGTDKVARIVVGTSSMTRTGTSSYPWQPRIQYDGATGQWSFKNADGTTTTAFGTVTAEYVAVQIGSTAANYVLQNNGSSTGQLATNPTLAGSTTIGTGSTIVAGGAPFGGQKVGYLADVTDYIQVQINGKQNSIGQTPLGSAIGSVTAALGSQSVNALKDMNIIMNEGDFLKIVDGQVVAGSSSTSVAYSAIIGKPTDNGTFSVKAAAGKIPVAGDNGSLDYSWHIGDVIRLIGTTTAQNSGSDTIIYTQISPNKGSTVGTQTALLLKFNNPGSSTFIDEGDLGFAVSTLGNAIGTNTSGILGTGGLGVYAGVNDYVSISHNNIFNLSTNKLTLGFRVRLDAITSTPTRLISKFQDSSNQWGIQYNGNDTLRVIALQAGGAAYNLLFSVPFTPATGTTYVIEYDRNGMLQSDHHLFIDGSPQNTTLISGAWNGAFDTNTGALTIGGDNRNDPSNWVNVKGMMDNVYLINGVVWHTGTYTVSNLEGDMISTYNQNIYKIVAPDNRVLMSFVDTGTYTSAGSTTAYIPGSTTVFNSQSRLSTSTVYAVHLNGGALSNLGYYTLCFDDTKVITDADKTSLKQKYLEPFYGMQVKESFARKDNIPWLDAANMAKEQYKQEKFNAWGIANIDKYYISGSGTTRLFQAELFKKDYENYIEEAWAFDLLQNDYIQDAKDEQDMDKTKRMLRPSLSDPSTPAIMKAGDGSGLSLDNSIAASILAIQDLNEKLGSATAEISSLTAALENQKIAYNEEVDNLYKWINAITIALITLGVGSGGWATLRNKRKGT